MFDSEKSYQLLQELREQLSKTALSFIESGSILLMIFEGKQYPPRETFYGYITDNTGIGKSSVNDRIDCFRKFGEIIKSEPELQGINPTKLRRLRKYVDEMKPSRERLTEWLYSAMVLSESDLKIYMEREKTGSEPAECGHTGWIEVVKRCSRCGRVLLRHKDNLTEIVYGNSAKTEKAEEESEEETGGEA